MHRLAGQDLDAPLFQRRQDRPGPSPEAGGQAEPVDQAPSSPASGLRVVLQISDDAPLVGSDEINWGQADTANLHSMPLTVGTCTVTVLAPAWPFQASGISPNQIMQPGCPPSIWPTNFIDRQYLNNWWDPCKVEPKGKRHHRGTASTTRAPGHDPGFPLVLDSSNPPIIAASPVADVGDPPPRRSGSESEDLSWHPRPSLGGME